MIVKRLYGTTNGSGALTVTLNEPVLGAVYAVQEIDGTFADGVDLTLTCENPDLSIPILTHANFNTDGAIYPRVATVSITDGTTTNSTTYPIVNGNLKMVIAQGGASASGGVLVYITEI